MAGEPARPKSYGRKHSVSSVNTYLGCPQRWFLRYVKRVKTPDFVVPQAWRFGTCVHAGLEGAYGAAMDASSRTHATAGTMLSYREPAVDALRAAWAKEEMPTAHGNLDGAIEMLDTVLEVLPIVLPDQVLGVEYGFDGSTPDGCLFIGYTDLLLRLSQDTLLIRDWKVTGRRASAEELGSDLQLNAYAHFARQDFPWAERVVVEHWYPTQARLGAPEPKVTVPSPAEAQREAIETIESVVEMIEADDVYEPKVSGECESCPFRTNGCPAWERGSDMDVAASEMAGF